MGAPGQGGEPESVPLRITQAKARQRQSCRPLSSVFSYSRIIIRPSGGELGVVGRGGEGRTLRAGGRPRAAGVRQALPDVPAPGGVRCRAGADRRAAGSPRRELDPVPLWRSSRFTVTIHWSGNRKKREAARKVRIRTCGRHRPRPPAGRRASQAGWGAYRSRGVVRSIGPLSHLPRLRAERANRPVIALRPV